MKRIIFLLTFLAGSVIGIAQQRITGGTSINITDAPWQVLLKINGDYVCGGSIMLQM
jgi:hypothetical protein